MPNRNWLPQSLAKPNFLPSLGKPFDTAALKMRPSRPPSVLIERLMMLTAPSTESQSHHFERYTDRVNLGALAELFPPEEVRAVLRSTGRESKRRRDLPAELMVYFVIGMALMFDEAYQEVLRRLLEGLKCCEALFPSEPPAGLLPSELRAWRVRQEVRTSGKSALYNGRLRLGEEPVKQLFETLAVPLADEGAVGCWYKGLRLTGFDGTTLNVWDHAENAEAFGYPSASRGQTAFPQVRLLTLVELGTHATLAAAFDGVRKASERALVAEVLNRLDATMLNLCDRGFYSAHLFNQAADTGAQLLWRVKAGLQFKCVQVLPDGSWLADLPRAKDKLTGQTWPRRRVRIIEYRFDGLSDTEPVYRLMTTLLDPKVNSAQELAALYHQRWEHESTFDEIKAHLLGVRPILRSRRPGLIRQEIWAILLAHYAIRALMQKAAHQSHLDPDQLSFIHTLRVVRRKLTSFAVFPPTDVVATTAAGSGRNLGGTC